MPRRPGLTACLTAVVLVAAPAAVQAHPHMFVDAKAEIIFDANGDISAIRNIWTFDEAFSAYAKQGLKHLPNGRLTQESLVALAKVNIHSLALYKFFTFVRRTGKLEPVGEGMDQSLTDDGEHLVLSFSVKPPTPLSTTQGPLTIALYDPEYFVAMTFVKEHPIKLINAPATCKQSLFTPTGLTPEAAALISQVPASQRDLPPELEAMTGGIENGVVIDCTSASGAGAATTQKPSAPSKSDDDWITKGKLPE
jgi:ABC-type uncharacterized transport system substrate-binding protein